MKQNTSPRINPETGQRAILLCAVLWSTAGLFIKLIDWNPILIAGMRSFIAALFLWSIRLVFPRRGSHKNNPFLIVIAGTVYAVSMIAFVTANKLTTSANAILLQYSAPIWAALLSRICIKETLRWEHWGALILIILGFGIFFKDSLGGGNLLGDGIGLVSGILFGAYSVLLRMQKDANPADSMLMSHIICAGATLPFMFIYPPSLTMLSMGAILYLGVIQIGCTSLLFAYGIKRISAVQVMLTAVIEPILNPVWVFMVTREKPSFSVVLGGSLIIIAVVASSFIGKQREKRAL